ncbi:MAG TPA: ABC transporter substrate-binding protein, partial [Cytophagales bacterium]|nr:ABC transporter substrate-binding protein [Cytophagales bacterium]
VPGTAGFVPYPLLFKHKIKGYHYNPDKAVALLKEAGYQNKKIKLTLFTTAPYKQISEYLQKSWSKIGILVDIEVNQASTHRDLANKGALPFFRGSWVGDYMDIENYASVFLSSNFAPSGPNKTRYRSEAYDNLYEDALVEKDSDKREDIYLKMDQLLMEDCPVLVLFYDELLRLTHNNIHGLDANPMNMLFLESVRKD